MSEEPIPYGPHKIAQNGQVVIPKEVLKHANLLPGASVYFVTVGHGLVELVPTTTMTGWVREGRPEIRESRDPGAG